MADISELERIKSDYKEQEALMQRLNGEEIQLTQEKDRLVKKMNSLGFDSRELLEKEIDKLDKEINDLIHEILKEVGKA
jgi:uncharacterized protein YacL (UPF0231 family)